MEQRSTASNLQIVMTTIIKETSLLIYADLPVALVQM